MVASIYGRSQPALRSAPLHGQSSTVAKALAPTTMISGQVDHRGTGRSSTKTKGSNVQPAALPLLIR
ncbi:hypothetical protein HAV15_001999 [Penicillium sp. str. |nr:hypothetical protein HAV15_001999 [Penicillium sp. str. \